MKKNSKQLLLLLEFQKFLTACSTGRRLMPSGKKMRPGSIGQYQCVYQLLRIFQGKLEEPLRIVLLHRSSLRNIQKEKNYWVRFFKQFTAFLYKEKAYHDHYANSVVKMIRTFFNYLSAEKSFAVGNYHRQFRMPVEKFTPVILSPLQLKFLITDKIFEESLPMQLKAVKDIFVFGCTVGLRCQDLIGLKKTNIQYSPEGVYVVLHTQKTGTEVRIPLPEYATDIISKYNSKTGVYALPRFSATYLNHHIKKLMEKAGWTYTQPKIRHRQGEPVEIKNKHGRGYRFCDHITIHTMRRTAITTLLLMGVDETSVRRISGHAPGSKEFYRYVVIVQDYLDAKVREAHQKLLQV